MTRPPRLLAAALAVGLLTSGCYSDADNAVREDDDSVGARSVEDVTCFSGTLLASGSSAQDNAMQEWIANYQGVCREATINYQAVGSGAGVEAFLAGTTAFAGSDTALKDDEVAQATARCGGNPPINLPMVVGPIAIAYNLQGVDDLVVDAEVLAGIFSGEITRWDDPALVALNPDADLPDSPIRALHRSDSSGTTDNFTGYLEAAAPDAWEYGSGKEWTAPGGEGAAQNAGLTQSVLSADGAITYIESSFAENAGLDVARIDTGTGEPVELTPETAAEAVRSAQVVGEGADLALDIDYGTTAPGAYPIILVTYEITCSAGLPPQETEAVEAFLSYTAGGGQAVLPELGYAPLPQDLAQQVRASVEGIATTP